MIKYFKQQKWTESKGNDVDVNQFYLNSISYSYGENSVMNKVVLNREETYILFLKNVDAESLKTKLERIENSARTDGVDVYDSSIEVERQENGYFITLTYSIRG